MRKILVPVDFGEEARDALGYATLLARSLAASIELLYVWRPPALASVERWLVAELDGAKAAACGRASAQLDALATTTRTAGLEVRCRLAVGDPAHHICDRARSGHFDLIVMGTHGRSGLAHTLAGSVAEEVMRHAPCPVMTVRAQP
jgi:nucleotide-binding universal stress UspA family protein